MEEQGVAKKETWTIVAIWQKFFAKSCAVDRYKDMPPDVALHSKYSPFYRPLREKILLSPFPFILPIAIAVV